MSVDAATFGFVGLTIGFVVGLLVGVVAGFLSRRSLGESQAATWKQMYLEAEKREWDARQEAFDARMKRMGEVEAFGSGVNGERWLMNFARKAAAKLRGFECKDCGLTHECARKASGHDCSLAELVCEAERLGLQ